MIPSSAIHEPRAHLPRRARIAFPTREASSGLRSWGAALAIASTAWGCGRIGFDLLPREGAAETTVPTAPSLEDAGVRLDSTAAPGPPVLGASDAAGVGPDANTGLDAAPSPDAMANAPDAMANAMTDAGTGLDAAPPPDATVDTGTDGFLWVEQPLVYPSGAGTSAVLSDGLHYMGGSSNFFGNTRYTSHYVYDDLTGTWSNAPADVPDTDTWGARAHAYQGKIYLLGGYPSGDRLREYDLASNSWSSRTAPPSFFNWGFASAVVGDALFAFGGEAGATTNGAGYRYDFATDTWSAVASIPLNHGRGTLSAAAVGDRIYVLNGNQDDGTTVLQIYDTVANTWSQGAVLAGHAFEAAAATVWGTQIYFFGGADNHDQADSTSAPATVSSAVNIYDTVTDGWSTGPPMGIPRMWATAEQYGGRLHVLGGLDANSQQLDSHEILGPP